MIQLVEIYGEVLEQHKNKGENKIQLGMSSNSHNR
jgi:hypothetical protein